MYCTKINLMIKCMNVRVNVHVWYDTMYLLIVLVTGVMSVENRPHPEEHSNIAEKRSCFDM